MGIYGGTKVASGFHNIYTAMNEGLPNPTNEGLADLAIGLMILGATGIAVPIYALLQQNIGQRLRRNENYQS